MIGTRTCLAFMLLCLIYFVAQLVLEKYSFLPSVKVDWTGFNRLPVIKWGSEPGADDYPDDRPPESYKGPPVETNTPTIPDEDKAHPNTSKNPDTDDEEREKAGYDDEVDDEKDFSASLSLHKWLMKRGLMPGKAVPIVTIADSSYLHILHATQQRLGKWGYDHDLIVLCLDEGCANDTELLNPYPGYLLGSDAPMHAVALFKFMANLNLSENGYDFVFLDADVFFTGSRDPFGVMLPLSNKTWDLQFQSDNLPDELNIGWYFARSTPATQVYFRHSFTHWIKTKTDAWDQAVMNVVKDAILQKQAALVEEIAAGSKEPDEITTPPLHIHMVELQYFRNFMKELLWGPYLFGNQTATDEYISTAAAIHYTCVQHDLKEYFGLYFSGFGDLHGYYSQPPPLLRPINISGTSDAVHKQVAFALALGRKTNRTVAWPDTVNVLQRAGDGTYRLLPRMPTAKAVSWTSAKAAGYEVVEGQYLQNRARNGLGSLTEVHWSLGEYVGEANTDPNVNWLDSLVESLVAEEGFPVVSLDFTDVAATWSPLMDPSAKYQPGYDESVLEVEAKFSAVFTESGMEEFSASSLADLGKCRWVDGGDGCLANC